MHLFQKLEQKSHAQDTLHHYQIKQDKLEKLILH